MFSFSPMREQAENEGIQMQRTGVVSQKAWIRLANWFVSLWFLSVSRFLKLIFRFNHSGGAGSELMRTVASTSIHVMNQSFTLELVSVHCWGLRLEPIPRILMHLPSLWRTFEFFEALFCWHKLGEAWRWLPAVVASFLGRYASLDSYLWASSHSRDMWYDSLYAGIGTFVANS
jgi:hypothetical protein